jgi:hypothetical protein
MTEKTQENFKREFAALCEKYDVDIEIEETTTHGGHFSSHAICVFKNPEYDYNGNVVHPYWEYNHENV